MRGRSLSKARPAPLRDGSARRGSGLGPAPRGAQGGRWGLGPGLAWPERLRRVPQRRGGGGAGAELRSDAPAPQCAQADDWRSAKAIYDFHALDIDGNDVSLEKYR